MLQTCSIQIAGRESNTKREVLNFGICQTPAPEAVEDELVWILDNFAAASATYQEGSTRPRLILSGFSLAFELKVLAKHYPRTLRYFSTWTDMQDLVRSMSNWATMLPVLIPGQVPSLVAMGFGGEHWAVNWRHHRAGNDTARTLAILIHLIARPDGAPELLIDKMPGLSSSIRRKHRSSKYGFSKQRPQPEETYPFCCKISVGGTMFRRSQLAMMHRFKQYNPVAIGISTKKENARWAWICLASLEDAKHLVQEVNGRTEKDGRVWEVVLNVTPEVLARTAEEWENIRRDRQARKDVADNLLRRERHNKAMAAELPELGTFEMNLDELIDGGEALI